MDKKTMIIIILGIGGYFFLDLVFEPWLINLLEESVKQLNVK